MTSVHRWLVVFALLASHPSLSVRGASAEEVAVDTSTITSLTPDEARALVAAFPGTRLRLHMPSGVGVEAIKFGSGLPLDSLKAQDAATAACLAEYDRGSGPLSLRGLTALDAATVKALAAFKGREVNLPSVATLDDDAVAALAECAGHCLIMPMSAPFQKIAAAETLTPEMLQLVCATSTPVTLPKITAFDAPDSVVIARALAAKKGPLSLPNLKKVSPRTLAALISNEDIEIPLIETLELIPEPDGSPTDDVVIPEGYEERQRQKR